MISSGWKYVAHGGWGRFSDGRLYGGSDLRGSNEKSLVIFVSARSCLFYQLLVKDIPLRIKGDLQSVARITTVRVLVAIMGSPTTPTNTKKPNLKS